MCARSRVTILGGASFGALLCALVAKSVKKSAKNQARDTNHRSFCEVRNNLNGAVRSLRVFALDLVTLEIETGLLWSKRYRRGEGHLREPVWKPLQLSHLGWVAAPESLCALAASDLVVRERL